MLLTQIDLPLSAGSNYNLLILIIPVRLPWVGSPEVLGERLIMFVDPDGPIETFKWGQFQIRGRLHSADGKGVGKDICIVGGEVQPWSARKGHRLRPKMVTCALSPGVRILVIGNGVNGAIRVPKKTRQAVAAAGIEELIIEKTPKACQVYNRLARKGEAVALLAHGTC